MGLWPLSMIDMSLSSVYSLPAVIGDQYILTSVLEEKQDTVVYAATQKDVQREVIVESLRPESMTDVRRVRFFIETARAQVRLSGSSVAASLELLYADETWHLAKERIKGEPLDMMLPSGRVLASSLICSLMMKLCCACLYMDVEGIASGAFSLSHTYLMGLDFRFDNMAVAGPRGRDASRSYLSEAARLIRPLLDETSPYATRVGEVLDRMRYDMNWNAVSPLLFDEELLRLQMEIVQTGLAASSPPGDAM